MATYAAYRHVELDNVGYGKKRVLKPPGGGSSDIFGAAPEETSPRRVKNHNQSQLGSALFGDGPNTGNNEPSSRSTSKPGNDSYNRLFGPPDAPPTTPNAKNHMRSNIPLSGDSSSISSCSSSSTTSSSSGTATSPAKSTTSNNSPSAAVTNGFANNLTNDITGGSSCITRNPVTGDGVEVTPVRRSTRRFRDGNPVTGTGYSPEAQNNGQLQNGTSSSSSEKSSDASPAAKAPPRTRVPPGGYSSGLW